MQQALFDSIFKALPSTRLIKNDGKVNLALVHLNESNEEVLEYFAKDGGTTTDVNDAQGFASHLPTLYLANYFKRKAAEKAVQLADLQAGNATVQFELPAETFVVGTLPTVDHPYTHYFMEWPDGRATTTIFDNASQYRTFVEAVQAAERYTTMQRRPETEMIVILVHSEEVERWKASYDEAAKGNVEQVTLEASEADIAARMPTELYQQVTEHFVIRFVDPELVNDLEGDTTCPNWVRYYCEGGLAQSLNAAEWFSDLNSAIRVARLLGDAKPEALALHDEEQALMLKMQILGSLTQTPSLQGVQVTFRESVILQVLRVVENNSTEEGYNWDEAYREDYRWVFEDPAMEQEEHEVEADEDAPAALPDDSHSH